MISETCYITYLHYIAIWNFASCDTEQLTAQCSWVGMGFSEGDDRRAFTFHGGFVFWLTFIADKIQAKCHKSDVSLLKKKK